MNPLHRIIDANANRAREALRVLEDLARFALNDGEIAGGLKGVRHGLIAAIEGVTGGDGLDLLASRDTEGDVGTAISTASEGSRRDLVHLARANASRLGEAMRSIEEAAKALGGRADAFERMRYAVYTIERRLALALARPTPPPIRLCVLVTESLCALPWETVVERSLAGGCNMLQVREKGLTDRALLDRVRRVMEIRNESGTGALVIVNDRADVAALAGADGVHVGQGDLSVADARRIVGERALVGVSTGVLDEARAGVRAGADVCGVGPMFATSTKDKEVTLGPGYLSAYLADPEASRVAHLAIGGITPANVGELAKRGCTGIAVSSVVCRDRNPESVCGELVAALGAEMSAPSRSLSS